MMPWLVLLASAVLEAVWASALATSDGFSHLVPTLVFLVAGTLSMLGLAQAVRTIPIGTAYAVWTGIVGAVIGLKVVGHSSADAPTPEASRR